MTRSVTYCVCILIKVCQLWETHQQVWSVDIQWLFNLKVFLALQGGLTGSFHQSLHVVLDKSKLALVGRHQLPVGKITVLFDWPKYINSNICVQFVNRNAYPWAGSSKPNEYSYLLPGRRMTEPSLSVKSTDKHISLGHFHYIKAHAKKTYPLIT